MAKPGTTQHQTLQREAPFSVIVPRSYNLQYGISRLQYGNLRYYSNAASNQPLRRYPKQWMEALPYMTQGNILRNSFYNMQTDKTS